MRVWVMTKFYDCPEHNWPWPVCTAYGQNHHGPGRQHPEWALVNMETSPVQIEAMDEDPRVIYCGKEFDSPPAQLLETFKELLDPKTRYLFMGQVIAKLAQTEWAFYHEVK